MKKDSMLGKKVKCSAYLKKEKIKYVYEDGSEKLEESLLEREEYLIYGEDIDGDESQKTKSIVHKNFEGIIVAKKIISTENIYTTSYHYNGAEFFQILKDGFIDCYLVFFRFGQSRLVPIEHCEVII